MANGYFYLGAIFVALQVALTPHCLRQFARVFGVECEPCSLWLHGSHSTRVLFRVELLSCRVRQQRAAALCCLTLQESEGLHFLTVTRKKEELYARQYSHDDQHQYSIGLPKNWWCTRTFMRGNNGSGVERNL